MQKTDNVSAAIIQLHTKYIQFIQYWQIHTTMHLQSYICTSVTLRQTQKAEYKHPVKALLILQKPHLKSFCERTKSWKKSLKWQTKTSSWWYYAVSSGDGSSCLIWISSMWIFAPLHRETVAFCPSCPKLWVDLRNNYILCEEEVAKKPNNDRVSWPGDFWWRFVARGFTPFLYTFPLPNKKKMLVWH